MNPFTTRLFRFAWILLLLVLTADAQKCSDYMSMMRKIDLGSENNLECVQEDPSFQDSGPKYFTVKNNEKIYDLKIWDCQFSTRETCARFKVHFEKEINIFEEVKNFKQFKFLEKKIIEINDMELILQKKHLMENILADKDLLTHKNQENDVKKKIEKNEENISEEDLNKKLKEEKKLELEKRQKSEIEELRRILGGEQVFEENIRIQTYLSSMVHDPDVKNEMLNQILSSKIALENSKLSEQLFIQRIFEKMEKLKKTMQENGIVDDGKHTVKNYAPNNPQKRDFKVSEQFLTYEEDKEYSKIWEDASLNVGVIESFGSFIEEQITTLNPVYGILLEHSDGGKFKTFWTNEKKAKYIKNPPLQRKKQGMNYFLQIARGVQCIHQLGYVLRSIRFKDIWMVNGAPKLRDLKTIETENIVLRRLHPDKIRYTMDPMCIEKSYLVKEKKIMEFMKDEITDVFVWRTQSDIYSLGSIAYYILNGKYPFKDDKSKNGLTAAEKAIKKHEYSMQDGIYQIFAEMVAQMLILNPEKRLNIDEIIEYMEYCIPPFKEEFVGFQKNFETIFSSTQNNLKVFERKSMFRDRIATLLGRNIPARFESAYNFYKDKKEENTRKRNYYNVPLLHLIEAKSFVKGFLEGPKKDDPQNRTPMYEKELKETKDTREVNEKIAKRLIEREKYESSRMKEIPDDSEKRFGQQAQKHVAQVGAHRVKV